MKWWVPAFLNACSSYNPSIHNPWDIRIWVLNLFMHHLLNVRHKTLPFSFNLSLLVPTVYLLHHDIYTLTHILRRNRVLSGYSCFARLDGWPNPHSAIQYSSAWMYCTHYLHTNRVWIRRRHRTGLWEAAVNRALLHSSHSQPCRVSSCTTPNFQFFLLLITHTHTLNGCL